MWSYDGSGGWFDHVTPPRVGPGATLGFRVPALLVSAYARKGQINHTVLDYTGALKFIESNWKLAPLTSRDAHANNLASAFDFGAGPRAPILIPPGHSALPAAGVPDAYLPPPTPVVAIYWLYGGAAVTGVALLIFAAWWPALSARRRAGARAPQPDGPSS
jgi:phospholipase C